jgi:hypothetical protein
MFELYGACCILELALDADCLESMAGKKCDFGAPASQAHGALRGCVQTTTGDRLAFVFTCSKDRNGRCQLVEEREQGQGQHLSPHEQHHRGGGGIEPSFCPRRGTVKPALWSAVDKVLSALLSCVRGGWFEVLDEVSTPAADATHKVSIRAFVPGRWSRTTL